MAAGAALNIVVRYAGNPRPIRTLWGEVGFEELTNGALVAGQPNGAMSWYPCDDHPSSKASYRIQISTDSPYHAVANGELLSRRVRAGMTTWTYELPEPTSSYLVTLQIGEYTGHQLAKSPVPMRAILPESLKSDFDADFAKQPEMMKLFEQLFGPYPLAAATPWWSPTTIWRYRWKRRASRSSGPTIATGPGVRSDWSPMSWPTSGSATA